MSLPVNTPVPIPEQNPIAGSVLPIQRAEELLATLPGVISARIVAGANGAVEEIHVLTTDEVQPKSTVRNIESALIAHLGMRVSHKKISVATSADPRPRVIEDAYRNTNPQGVPAVRDAAGAAAAPAAELHPRRRVYFEDVEVRRSRTKGVAVRVTLRKGDESYSGEAEGLENERLRIELAARATLVALANVEGEGRMLGLEGCRTVDAFEREFVFVGVTARIGRDTVLMTGSAEVRDSAETAAVLAVLDATNRWIEYVR